MPFRIAALRPAAVAVIGAMALSIPAPVLLAQARPSPANNPDVLGAERLFSAWLEGQIAYRGLPGIAVGVVADQEQVWAGRDTILKRATSGGPRPTIASPRDTQPTE